MRFFKRTNIDLNPEAELKAFFKEYNCKYKVADKKGSSTSKVTRYYFDYQGGHFISSVYDNEGMELCYPNCFDVSMSQLGNMRAICNKFNNIGLRFKCTYTIDDEKNTANLQVYAYCTTVARDFKKLLDMCFGVARDFADDYNKLLKQCEDNGFDDAEAGQADKDREFFLLMQQEFACQGHKRQVRLTPEQPFSIERLLHDVIGEPEPVCESLTVLATEADAKELRLTDGKTIASYDLAPAPTAGDDKPESHDHMLLLKYHNAGLDTMRKTLAVTVTCEGTDDTTTWLRITACEVRQRLSRTNTHDHEPTDGVLSFLVARDVKSTKQKVQEFNYMWQEAQINLKEKGYDSLPADQKLIVDVEQGCTGYNLYWGYRHLLREDYYAAMVHFQNVLAGLKTTYLHATDRQQNLFYQVSYYMGFCCNALHQYEKACYYLRDIYDCGMIKYAMAYVNALVSLMDVRVFDVIEHLKVQVEDHYGPDDELPDSVDDFLDFLKRRYVTALISFKEFDKAEAILKKMVEDDSSDDFAIRKLAELVTLRGKERPTDDNQQQH